MIGEIGEIRRSTFNDKKKEKNERVGSPEAVAHELYAINISSSWQYLRFDDKQTYTSRKKERVENHDTGNRRSNLAYFTLTIN